MGKRFADMINIFEVFLPQLLRYPNPNDPLNGEAAALMMRHPKEYEIKVKGEVHRGYRERNRELNVSDRVRPEVCDKGSNRGCW